MAHYPAFLGGDLYQSAVRSKLDRCKRLKGARLFEGPGALHFL